MNAWIERWNEASAIWFDSMLAVSWQAALLVIAAALVAKLLSKSAPAARCWLWQIVACKLLVMPLWGLTLAVPWPAEVVEHPLLASEIESSPAPGAADTIGVTVNGDRLTATERPWGVAAAFARHLAGLAGHRVAGIRRHSLCTTGNSISTPRPTAPRVDPGWRRADCHRARGRRSAAPATIPRVLLTEQSCSPFVCGIWRATLVLPRSLVAQLTPAQLRQALAHELRTWRGETWPGVGLRRSRGPFTSSIRPCTGRRGICGWRRELACDQMALGGLRRATCRVCEHAGAGGQPPVAAGSAAEYWRQSTALRRAQVIISPNRVFKPQPGARS